MQAIDGVNIDTEKLKKVIVIDNIMVSENNAHKLSNDELIEILHSEAKEISNIKQCLSIKRFSGCQFFFLFREEVFNFFDKLCRSNNWPFDKIVGQGEQQCP